MEKIRHLENRYVDFNSSELKEVCSKLPPILISLKDEQFKPTISRLVDNYNNFIIEIDLIANLLVNRSIKPSTEHLNLLKSNYHVLSILLGEQDYLLTNLIKALTPEGFSFDKGDENDLQEFNKAA